MADPPSLSDADTRVKSLSTGEIRALSEGEPTSGNEVTEHGQPERFGSYQLLRRLGTGGMAEVFLARPPREGADLVVIKRMLPQLAEQERFIDMFRREARVAMRLDHPNVVKVYGVVEDRGQIGLVMEYLEGLTLYDLAVRAWDSGRSLPLEPLVKMLIDAARALHFAHHLPDEQGSGTHIIVHRDVSPDNLLVTKQGVTKLLDFGVAKPDDDSNLTRTGQVKGKVSYMSPEQARGEKLDGRSDLFSLGVSFYWLLTGIRPFDRENPVATMEAVVLADVPRPSELNDLLPHALELVVLRLLERDRRFRTPTGAELASQLEQLLHRVPRDHMSPARLLENILDTEPSQERPWPTHVAVPSVDWVSGEKKALSDPSSPRPTGEWAALQTRQFPVFGLSELSAQGSDVFTAATIDAIPVVSSVPELDGVEPPTLRVADVRDGDTIRMAAVPHDFAGQAEPATVPMRKDGSTSSFASDIETDPGEPLTGPVTQPSINTALLVDDLPLPPHSDPDTLPERGPPTIEAATLEMPAEPRSISVPEIPPFERRHRPSSPTASFVVAALLLALLAPAAFAWLYLHEQGDDVVDAALLTGDGTPDERSTNSEARPTEALDKAQATVAASTGTDAGAAPTEARVPATKEAPEPRTAEAPAVDDDDSAQSARPVQGKKPRTKRVAEQTVALQGPPHIVWKQGRKAIARGAKSVSVPDDVVSLTAYDSRRRVRSTVPIEGGVASFDALATESLVIRVRPWAKVWLGGEELGLTPLKPVAVVPGRYKLKLEWEGTTREQSVRVSKGAGQVVVNVNMRSDDE